MTGYRSSKSYVGFPCANCKAPIKLFIVLGDTPPPVFIREEAMRLDCLSCGQQDSYDLRKLVRFEEYQVH